MRGIVIWPALLGITTPIALWGMRTFDPNEELAGICLWVLELDLFMVVMWFGDVLRYLAVRAAVPGHELGLFQMSNLSLGIGVLAGAVGWPSVLHTVVVTARGLPTDANSIRSDLEWTFILALPGAFLGGYIAWRVENWFRARAGGALGPCRMTPAMIFCFMIAASVSVGTAGVFTEYTSTCVVARAPLRPAALVGYFHEINLYQWGNARSHKSSGYTRFYEIRFGSGFRHRFYSDEIALHIQNKSGKAPICMYFPNDDPRSRTCAQPSGR